MPQPKVTTLYTTYCKRCGEYFESESLVALSNWNRMHEHCNYAPIAVTNSNTGGRQGS